MSIRNETYSGSAPPPFCVRDLGGAYLIVQRMAHFPMYTLMSAPGGSKPFVSMARRAYKSVPNLVAELAESPQAIEAYFSLGASFERSELNPAERQVVLLTASIEHECHYCMAVHIGEAALAGVPGAAIEALRCGAPIEDRRLEALRAFTAALIRTRGVACQAEADLVLARGFPRAVLLDIMIAVAQKMISNYVNHIAETPLDDWLAPALKRDPP